MASKAVELVLSKLPSVKRMGDGWNAKCPAHRDRAPSLKLDQGADGRALIRCHAGCTTEAIVAAMGLSLRDLMPETADALAFSPSKAGHTPRLQVVGNTALKAEPELAREKWPEVCRYDYTDADGVLQFQVVRLEAPDKSGKRFLQQQPNGVWGLKGIEHRPLFRLPSVREAVARGDVIVIVEGEKDVLTAEGLGWAATTNCGGASAWKPEHADVLRGADVVVIPDNDEPGRKWAETVATSVVSVAKRVRVIALPRVPSKGDLTDWVQLGGTSDALGGLIVKAPAWAVGDPIPEPPAPSRFRVYRADELINLPPASWLVEDVLPTDALAALVGPSGKGKTFVTLDLSCSIATGRRWLGHRSIPAAPVLYIAAEGTAGLRARVAAWIAEHGQPAAGLPVYFICETVNLLEPQDVDHVIRAMAALPQPPALVIVDTLHRAMPGGDENSAKDVGLVITNADRVRRAVGCTVLMVHHSKKDADIERGSTSLRAACDTLLMLRDDEGSRSLTCEKQKDAADFAPHVLDFRPVHGSVIVALASGTNGETERTADPYNLSANERQALIALADAGIGAGLTSTEWTIASGVTPRSFYRVKAALIRAGLVSDGSGRGSRYSVTSTGLASLRVTATVTAKNGENDVAGSGSNFSSGTVGGGPLKGPSPLTTVRNTGSIGDRKSRGSVSASPTRRRGGPVGPPAWVVEPREFDDAERFQ